MEGVLARAGRAGLTREQRSSTGTEAQRFLLLVGARLADHRPQFARRVFNQVLRNLLRPDI